jgi:hypothetical protein
MISAAATYEIFFAIAFNSTSCSLIIRCIPAAVCCRVHVNDTWTILGLTCLRANSIVPLVDIHEDAYLSRYRLQGIYVYESCRGRLVLPGSRVLREFIRSNGFD